MGGFHTHDLSHSGDPEGCLFNGLRHLIKGTTLDALQRVVHNTGTGNAHIQHRLRLAHTVERTCHKGVILYRIGKDHQLGAAKTVVFFCPLCGLLNDTTHLGYRIHIDACLGGAYIDAGADTVGQR